MVKYSEKSEPEEELDVLFGALASKHRRAIIYTLGLRPASISQLASRQGLSLPAIYKHIKVLEQAKLVQRKKVGRVNFLALNKATLSHVQDWLKQYHTYWGNQDETLENYVAGIVRSDLLNNTGE